MVTRTRALQLEDALKEITRLKRILHQIVDVDDDHPHNSKGRKIELVKLWARQGLMNIEDP